MVWEPAKTKKTIAIPTEWHKLIWFWLGCYVAIWGERDSFIDRRKAVIKAKPSAISSHFLMLGEASLRWQEKSIMSKQTC